MPKLTQGNTSLRGDSRTMLAGVADIPVTETDFYEV